MHVPVSMPVAVAMRVPFVRMRMRVHFSVSTSFRSAAQPLLFPSCWMVDNTHL